MCRKSVEYTKQKNQTSKDHRTKINGKIFECNKCGACCKHINIIPELKDFDVGNGICKYLTNENLCSIYDHRPNLCRGSYVYSKYYSNISVDQFYTMIHKMCSVIQKIDLKNTKVE